MGLVDARLTRLSSPTGRADERVVEAVRQAVKEQEDASTGTADRIRKRTEKILADARVSPAEVMPFDSPPLNVAARLDNGMTDRPELTWMIDLATRTIPAAVLRPSAKSVDAALLLARCLTPEPMRPGWADALRMSRSVLPHLRLAGIDQRLADAAARPVIVPGTIVCDHGMVYMSQTPSMLSSLRGPAGPRRFPRLDDPSR